MSIFAKQTPVKQVVLSLVILCLLGLASIQVNAGVVDEIEKSFQVDSNSRFSLENVNGAVNIQSWDKSEIKVSVTITADDQRSIDNISIDMKQHGNKVSVETRYDHNSKKSNNSATVKYQVFVPTDTHLSQVSVVNGALNIENVQGKIHAEAVNGAVVAKGLAANSEISAVNGSIKVYYQILADSLDEIELETVNGSIKLYLPESISASLDLETMHGSIKTDFGLSSENNMFSGRHLNGNVGSGDIKITLESVNGSLKVLKH